MTATCKVAYNGKSLTTKTALLDTGANGYLFIDAGFAHKALKALGLKTKGDFTSAPVGGYDGTG